MSVMMIVAWRCDLCGHVWLARGPRPPELCARCRKRRWHARWEWAKPVILPEKGWWDIGKVEGGTVKVMMAEGVGLVVVKVDPAIEHRLSLMRDVLTGIAPEEIAARHGIPIEEATGEIKEIKREAVKAKRKAPAGIMAGWATPTAQDARHGASETEMRRNPRTLWSQAQLAGRPQETKTAKEPVARKAVAKKLKAR
jgi:hypothetical protein